MTNKEAIHLLEYYKGKINIDEAIDLAIKALEERPQGDVISREALLKAMEEERQFLLARGQTGAEHILVHHCLPLIDNAPTVERPQGEEGSDEVADDKHL